MRAPGPTTLAALLLAAACASAPDPAPPLEAEVEVSALIYSGVRNPRASLDARQVQALIERIEALPPQPDFEFDFVMPARLGYSGVAVTHDGEIAGLPRSVRVWGGSVELIGDQTTHRRDPEGALEDWLIHQLVAAGALDEGELEIVSAR